LQNWLEISLYQQLRQDPLKLSSTQNSKICDNKATICFKHNKLWPIKRVKDFQCNNRKESYLIKWEPSTIKFCQLVERYSGESLKNMAKSYNSIIPNDRLYHNPCDIVFWRVNWSNTWVSVSELERTGKLIYDYWMEISSKFSCQ